MALIRRGKALVFSSGRPDLLDQETVEGIRSATHVDRIYTLNLKHFQSIAPPEISSKLSEP